MLTPEQKGHLIQEVRRYTCLYDVTCRGYKDRALCDSSWDDIAQTLGIDVEMCKRTWRSLRDEFTKRRKMMSQKRSKTVYELNRKWPFYSELMFIQRFINKKPPKSASRKSQEVTTKQEDNNDCVTSEDDVVDENVNKSGLIINSGTRNGSTLCTFPYSDHKRESSLYESSFSPMTDYDDIDEDALFGRIVTSTLRKLSPKINAEAKARIQNMLYEVQYGSLPPTISNQSNFSSNICNQNSSFQRNTLPTITSVFSQASSPAVEKITDASNISAD